MGTKSGLLALLQQNEGEFLSGEEAAKRLGVSRAAVWKALNGLRAQGLLVESVPGSGYRLLAGSDLLNADALHACMRDDVYPVRVMEEVDSTNLEAKRWAMEGAPHGSLVVSARQTAGRGRLGRSFASPPGGMYLSVVLRPKYDLASAVLITSATAVAACRAVAELCGIELAIKWVNDLYLGTKKCCGILTEAGTGFESGAIEYMVVGIGINHSTPPADFGPEVAKVATSLFPSGRAPVSRAQLAAAVHARLMEVYETLESREFLQEYRQRSNVLGRRVTVMANPPYEAEAVAIDDDAHLLVRRADGRTEELSYGEISVRLA